MSGKKWDDFIGLPTLEGADELLTANLTTAHYPVRVLGGTADGLPVVLSEEDRGVHIHVLGEPGSGKSKFLELLIRQDIQRGYGACLIDPGESGDTVVRLLKYCCKIGFEKVLYISPTQFHRRLPVINPLRQGLTHTAPIGGLMDTLRVLWNTKDYETPRIQRYVPAVLHAIYAAKLTLAETKWFMARDKGLFQSIQDRILQHLPEFELSRKYLEEAFHGSMMTWKEFQSTINRLNVFADPTLRRFVGSKMPAIDWNQLIKDGWLILVNLDTQRIWEADRIYQRLIGTLIINEITRAISAIFRGSKGQNLKPFYLYLDEAGQYMTPKVADILDLKRKTPLKFTISHQRFDQIEDRDILSSVRTSAQTKIMFSTSNTADRKVMMQDMGYGGDLSDRDVMYALGDLKKQQAAIRVARMRPRLTTITEVPDTHVPNSVLTAYLEQLYSYEWFYPAADVDAEINARFPTTIARPGGFGEEGRNRPQGARQRQVRNRKTARKPVPEKPERKGYFDD